MKKTTVTLLLFCLFSTILTSQASLTYADGELLVMFSSNATNQDIAQIMNDFSATEVAMTPDLEVRKWQIGPFPIVIDPNTTVYNTVQALGVLLGHANVDGAGLNYSLAASPDNTSLRSPMDPKDYNPLDDCVDYPGSLYYASGSSEIDIAIIDTGVDLASHTDWFGELIETTHNFITNGTDVSDDNGHGTRTAGIIAGMIQTADIPNAKLHIYKALDASGNGSLYNCIQAVDDCVNKKIDIVNVSWGYFTDTDDNNSPFLSDVFHKAASQGTMIIASAGNDGLELLQNQYMPGSLGANSGLITVAATECDGNLASFSNYSMTNVDIGAPGVHIACPNAGGDWVHVDGTSYAAPIVTGIAVQLASTMNAFDPIDLEQVIFNNSVEIPAMVGYVETGSVASISKEDESIKGLNKGSGTSIHSDYIELEVEIAPNPFEQSFQLNIQSQEEKVANLRIVNTLGQTVFQQNISLQEGDNLLPVQPNLTGGMYHLILEMEDERVIRNLFRSY